MFRVLIGIVLLVLAQEDKKGPPPDPKPKIAMAFPALPSSSPKSR